MEDYIIHMFYLAIILTLGILITAVSSKLKVSSILFLVLTGYILQLYGFDFFTQEFVLIVGSLALIVIVLETTMGLALRKIVSNFLHVIKFTVLQLILCMYALSLLIFQLFDFPGQQFEAFLLCVLLSIIIYGVDPNITSEFSTSKRGKIREMLEIEGIIAGPITVLVAFFLIDFLTTHASITDGLTHQTFDILRQMLISIAVGGFFSYITFKHSQHFKMSKELLGLFVISVGMIVFVIVELASANGSFAVAVYGVMFGALIQQTDVKKYSTMLAHILYIIVFILLGIELVLPSLSLWLKALVVYGFYLGLRFCCSLLLYRDLSMREKVFVTLNVAKGIEVALVLFIMKLNFGHLVGIDDIISIGFLFFILSYLTATAVNYWSTLFLEKG